MDIDWHDGDRHHSKVLPSVCSFILFITRHDSNLCFRPVNVLYRVYIKTNYRRVYKRERVLGGYQRVSLVLF